MLSVISRLFSSTGGVPLPRTNTERCHDGARRTWRRLHGGPRSAFNYSLAQPKPGSRSCTPVLTQQRPRISGWLALVWCTTEAEPYTPAMTCSASTLSGFSQDSIFPPPHALGAIIALKRSDKGRFWLVRRHCSQRLHVSPNTILSSSSPPSLKPSAFSPHPARLWPQWA